MLIALSVGGVYLFYHQSPKNGSELEDAGKQVFPELTAESITRLKVSYPGGAYELRAPHWTLLDPQGAPTDESTVRTILENFTKLTFHNVIGKPEQNNDDIYGLATPEFVIMAGTTSGEKTISFGKSHSFSGRRYAQIQGDERVLLVGDTTFRLLSKKKEDIRTKRPLQVNADQLVEVIVERHRRQMESALKFHREQDGQWFVESGNDSFLAEHAVLRTLVQNLTQIPITGYVDQPTENVMERLANPDYSVHFKLDGNAASLSIIFARGAEKESERLYFRRLDENWIYEGPAGNLALLQRGSDTFRDRTPFDRYPVTDLRSIEMKRAGDEQEAFTVFSPAKGEKNWRVERKDGGMTETINQESLRLWLKEFAALEVLAYAKSGEIDRESAGLNEPVLEVTFFTNDTAKQSGASYQLLVGKMVGEREGKGAPRRQAEPKPSIEGEEMLPTQFESTGAPRYGQITLTNGEALIVIISSETWRRLDRHLADFLENK